MSAPQVPTGETLRQLPLADVRESKTNPRTSFDKAALEDLAASIRAQGVVQPILVRPRSGTTTVAAGWEIVAGARRYRAAKAAQLATIPAVVRELTDAQVLEIQIVENLQREDVHPMDEARGYAYLIGQTGKDVAVVAAEVGKSVSYIYQRLKLTSLVPKVEKAFLDGTLSAGHAVLIARLTATDQLAALEHCDNRWDRQPGVRDLARWIAQECHLVLAGAPFHPDDAQLLPKAGPCVACPKRTGHTPALYPEIKQDTCTDRVCYQAKAQAMIQRTIEAAKADGKPLCEASTKYRLEPAETKRGVLGRNAWDSQRTTCPHSLAVIFIDGEQRGKTCKVCTKPDACKVHNPHVTSPARNARGLSKAQKRKTEAARITWTRTLDAVLLKVKKPGPVEQRATLTAFVSSLGWDTAQELGKRHGWKPTNSGFNRFDGPARSAIAKMDARALARLEVELVVLMGASHRHEISPEFQAIARRYKINTGAIARRALAEVKKKT